MDAQKKHIRQKEITIVLTQLLRLLPAFVIMMGFTCNVKAETITLASNGVAYYSIVLPESASPAEAFGSNELKKYLSQISEANFVLSQRLNDHSIIACSEVLLQTLTPDVNIPRLQKEDYGIFVRNDNLYLVGSSERAVLYAVYDFLTGLGCRWIAPDFEFYEGDSQFIPDRDELNYIHSNDLIRRPALNYRKLYIEEGLSHNTRNLLKMVDWMPKARFNILVVPINYRGYGRVQWDNWREQLTPELKKRGIIIEVGGHGYQNFLNSDMENGDLFKNHPEWFGLDGKGDRSQSPGRVFCTSNPEAVEYLHKNILEYLQTHPEINIFDFWPPDSEKWCECGNCKALGTATERHALLVSQTARFINKEKPDVRLECLAYSRYTKPPNGITLDSKVLLDFCPINQSFEYQIYDDSSSNNKEYKTDLLNWLDIFYGDISIYSYYRKYAWRSLPNIIPHYMQNDLRFYYDAGVKGISVYSEPGDWFAYGINHYVLGHLAWDPDVNVDNLIADYCSKLYGPATDLAVLVCSSLEDIVRYGCNIPHTKPKSTEQYQQFISKLSILKDEIKAAKEQYASDEHVCWHLNRLELMVEYASKNIEIMNLRVEGGQNNESVKIAADIKNMINENNSSGVFIPR